MKEHFEKLFEYNNWANLIILNGVLGIESFPSEAQKLFNHILIAEKTWMERINSSDHTSSDFWYNIPPNELETILNTNSSDYLELIRNSNDKQFRSEIKYKNSKGLEFTTTLKDILSHVSAHGAYHRGQINLSLREAGIETLNVDYIAYTRIK